MKKNSFETFHSFSFDAKRHSKKHIVKASQLPIIQKIPNFSVNQEKPFSSLLLKKGISSFQEAILYLFSLPYYPISDVNKLSLVITEGCGTCSTKHGLLKAVAEENFCENLKLYLIYYPFYAHFIKELEPLYHKLNLDYTLEAHFFLSYEGNLLDITSSQVDMTSFYNLENTFEQQELTSRDIGTSKQNEYIERFKNWCHDNQLDFDSTWKLKISAIKFLSDLDLASLKGDSK